MCDAASAIKMLQIGASTAAQAQQYRTNRRSALEAEAFANMGIAGRVMQENQATTDQMVKRSRDAMREVGSLNAIFADSGLEGNSHDRIIAEAEGAADHDAATLARNRDLRIEQGNAEIAANRANAQTRINSAPRPSIVETGLQIAGATIKPKRDK